MHDKIKKNAVLNVIRNILNIVFPLITFPYVSRVLGVENIGKYNFASTYVSYFVLFAGLGVGSYVVREGAQFRSNKQEFSAFFSEVFSINVISTVLSYICLFITLVTIRALDEYRNLILIFGLQIGFTTIGVESVFSLYEDYDYITKRTIAFKLVSLVGMFVFVRNANDLNVYALITVVATVGSNTINLVYSKKYWSLKQCTFHRIMRHLKAVLVMFASSVAVMIYVYSDTTMLGFMQSDYIVGLYSVASKVYVILKSIISAILIVTIPQLSSLWSKNLKQDFQATVQKVIDTISVLLLPCVVGMFMISDNIVYVIAGSEYIEASNDIKILSVALLCCLYGWIFNQCVLMPTKNEKIISVATSISALINILLNFILIPYFAEKAAAMTTLISELFMLLVCYRKARIYGDFRIANQGFKSILIGCGWIVIVCVGVKIFVNNILWNTAICIIGSIVVYGICLVKYNNGIFLFELKKIKNKFWR